VLPVLLGSADATVAASVAGQPALIAALASFTERAPILVVTATGVEAERLADDLTTLLEPDQDELATVGAVTGPVAVLPAWETLPFERVSPEVETMGRRL
jgi:transcription-repair coupling factor (superfamily II helicase)